MFLLTMIEFVCEFHALVLRASDAYNWNCFVAIGNKWRAKLLTYEPDLNLKGFILD